MDAAEPYKLEFSLEYGEGDGSVNAESLKQCKKWSDQQKKDPGQPRIHYEEFLYVKHAAMVTGEWARRRVVDTVTSINKQE